MWHLVCGDAAVEGVSFALGQDAARESLRVMRDDLAVGPLQGIDSAPCTARSTYWQGVWPQAVQPMPDFTTSLSEDARWLAGLAQAGRAVTVWHGDSCSEQLLLARLAHALAGSSVELWQVACGNPQRPPRKAVSLRTPHELVELYQQRRLLDQPQREQLALRWQQACAANAAIRLCLAGNFHGGSHDEVDQPLLRACSQEWRPLARAMASVMAQTDGFFPSDFFLYWRARELASAGLIELDQAFSRGYAEQQVRLPSER